MQKFKVEYTFIDEPPDGRPTIRENIVVVEAEHRTDALIAALHQASCRLIQRIRAVPMKPITTGNVTEIPEHRTCGTCGWLHDASPQFTSSLYDNQRGQGWCWAVPSHVHRSAKLPACALWQAKEE